LKPGIIGHIAVFIATR